MLEVNFLIITDDVWEIDFVPKFNHSKLCSITYRSESYLLHKQLRSSLYIFHFQWLMVNNTETQHKS